MDARTVSQQFSIALRYHQTCFVRADFSRLRVTDGPYYKTPVLDYFVPSSANKDDPTWALNKLIDAFPDVKSHRLYRTERRMTRMTIYRNGLGGKLRMASVLEVDVKKADLRDGLASRFERKSPVEFFEYLYIEAGKQLDVLMTLKENSYRSLATCSSEGEIPLSTFFANAVELVLAPLHDSGGSAGGPADPHPLDPVPWDDAHCRLLLHPSNIGSLPPGAAMWINLYRLYRFMLARLDRMFPPFTGRDGQPVRRWDDDAVIYNQLSEEQQECIRDVVDAQVVLTETIKYLLEVKSRRGPPVRFCLLDHLLWFGDRLDLVHGRTDTLTLYRD